MENNELQHAGIKGMRWGIRRFQNKDGSLTPEGKKRYADKDANESGPHDDHNKARAKSASSMSDKELQDAIVRLQREQLYGNLTASKGKVVANKVLDKIGNKTLEVAANKFGEHVLSKAFDIGFEIAGRKAKAGIGKTAEGRKFLRKYGMLP